MTIDRSPNPSFVLTGPLFIACWLSGELLVGWMFGRGISQLPSQWKQDGQVAVYSAAIFLLPMAMWLIGWTTVGALLVRGYFWNALGREVIETNRGLLTIKRSLLGRTWKTTYRQHHAKSFRLITCRPKSWAAVWAGQIRASDVNCVAFDYEGKTIVFGHGVTSDCANKIIEGFDS